MITRVRVRIQGTVQGVGFRPHVFRQAEQHGMSGWVLNDAEGVLLEAQGAEVDGFVHDLEHAAPPLARILRCEVEAVAPVPGEAGFLIRPSTPGTPGGIAPPTDTAVCEACLEELFDPESRYHGYPFLNCTDCGPRYTLIRSLPYDRALTSMAAFPMCPACAAEYGDPRNRRFHAQPTACPTCGPRLALPVKEIVARLSSGEILALKGIGGYHLVCDARNQAAVTRLRERKHREAKPLAVMVANLASARQLATISDEAAELLMSPERPIVILPRRDDLAPAVAPDWPWLGLMLPYAPLHHLLFHEAAGRPVGPAWRTAPQELVLVMTSANLGGEPLVADDEEARVRLAAIADALVPHDRPIVIRADDPVIRPGPAGAIRLRSGRGQAPCRIPLGRNVPPLLAMGASLKTTVCLTRQDAAYVSQHLGDLDDQATEEAYAAAIAHLASLLGVTPAWVVHDLHPDLRSTRRALGMGVPTRAIQHHHAHLGAVMAEHGLLGPALGLALDGYGMGPRGEAWGGELFRVERGAATHLGGLAELMMPGGDRAAREPWRMAAAALHAMGRPELIPARFADQPGAELVGRMLASGFNAPPTSSAGRLFDAAAGLLGIRSVARYEGQAAQQLEGLVTTPVVDPGLWRLAGDRLDLLPLLARLVELDPVAGANLFHGTLAAALVAWVTEAARAHDLVDVVLGGGCCHNQILMARLLDGLERAGLRGHTARELSPGDGGLSLGQAWLAAWQIEES